MNGYDIISQLTSPIFLKKGQAQSINSFANEFGYVPSAILDLPDLSELANTHIIVERGLENIAVITFMQSPRRFTELSYSDKEKILSIAYNNLVDWHIIVDSEFVSFVYVRTRIPTIVKSVSFTLDNTDDLYSQSFDDVLKNICTPNFPALDTVLIETILKWKKNICTELGENIGDENFAALFSALIFTRAIEDNNKRFHPELSQALLNRLVEADQPMPIREAIRITLLRLINNIPNFILSEDKLQVFDQIDNQIILAFVTDFYKNKKIPYSFDFSIMSTSAISRTLEIYSSLLVTDGSPDSGQLYRLPEVDRSRRYGSVYTPQFIARFFAKFLFHEIPLSAQKDIKVADPACGYGIFLRTFLETQFYVSAYLGKNNPAVTSFENVLGIDIDKNACLTTQLSLTMLSMNVNGSLPQELNIFTSEAVDFYLAHPELKGSYDAVISNPPFVSRKFLTAAMIDRIANLFGDSYNGIGNLYQVFINIGMEMLKPGGFGMFVLPKSFLNESTSRDIREALYKSNWVRCISDLSAIRVFNDSIINIILLIFQKKKEGEEIAPPAIVLKAQDFVGQALQDVLNGNEVETNFYSIYSVEQSSFRDDKWLLLPSFESNLVKEMAKFPKVKDFLSVHRGFMAAGNEFFIKESELPIGEENIYIDYLSNRDMKGFRAPEHTSTFAFFPYINGRKITEKELGDLYPKTWLYLKNNRKSLENRLQVKQGKLEWWMPYRPWEPKFTGNPKIVVPEIALIPRFSVDLAGKYAVSKSLYLLAKSPDSEFDLLMYFLAIFNSSVVLWYIDRYSSNLSGHLRLEKNILEKIPVPDPLIIPSTQMRKLIKLVQKRIEADGKEILSLEIEINTIVADLYGLSQKERELVGMDK